MARKIANGVHLTQQCWQALRQNPQLIIFPLMSSIALVIVAVLFAIPTLAGVLLLRGGQTAVESPLSMAEWIVAAVMLFLFYFVCCTNNSISGNKIYSAADTDNFVGDCVFCGDCADHWSD